MKAPCLLLMHALVLSLGCASADRLLFEEWASRHKVADVSEGRYRLFKRSHDHVKATNDADTGVKLRLNKLAALSDEEYNGLLGYRPWRPTERNISSDQVILTTASGPGPRPGRGGVNWTSAGAVTPVKNQGSCGSCWAFTAVAALESLHAINTKQLVSLSDQNVLDCVRDPPSQGCGGGNHCMVFDVIGKNKRAPCQESEYPYKARRSDTCGRCKPTVPATSGVGWVPPMNETALLEAVKRQPVAVAIDASSLHFRLYDSGIIGPRDCGTKLDHGVLLTGYGRAGKTNYWIIKNSWGPDWGENGYARLRRGMSHRPQGTCGITLSACFPLPP